MVIQFSNFFSFSLNAHSLKKKKCKFHHFKSSVHPASALLAHSKCINSGLQNVPPPAMKTYINDNSPKKGS